MRDYTAREIIAEETDEERDREQLLAELGLAPAEPMPWPHVPQHDGKCYCGADPADPKTY